MIGGDNGENWANVCKLSAGQVNAWPVVVHLDSITCTVTHPIMTLINYHIVKLLDCGRYL